MISGQWVAWAGASAGYVVATFFLSALCVRFAPRSFVGKAIRCRLHRFLALPILLLLAGLQFVPVLFERVTALLRRSFELVSGRELYVRKNSAYYYANGRSRPTKRHSGQNDEAD